MNEILKIKCPFCGAVLSVKNQPGIEGKSVKCPVCAHKYPFTEFKKVSQMSSDDDPGTDYPGSGGNKAGGQVNDESTSYGQEDFTLGCLSIPGTGISFRLRPGRNVIGRKATHSSADFQIDTGGDRSMSREHIVIDVKIVPKKGFVHYVSLFKEKVNKTYIGHEPLLYGDCMVLNHGDVVKLPGTTLKFEIPDGEGTDL